MKIKMKPLKRMFIAVFAIFSVIALSSAVFNTELNPPLAIVCALIGTACAEVLYKLLKDIEDPDNEDGYWH